MRQLTKVLALLTLASVFAVTAALSQTNRPSLWTVDENGPALFQGPNFTGYANGAYKVDPISGLAGWYYPLAGGLPNALVPGDVLLLEVPGTTQVSDLLRFDGAGMFFFSDLEPGEPNPDRADVPVIPPAINPLVLNEIGPEGQNGVFYFPLPGQPGFDLSGQFPLMQYNIISDVPEPGSAALLLSGAGLLARSALRRKTRR